jgi:hypothetical protein
MKQVPLSCIFAISLLACTGCVSSSINDSIALIEREENEVNNRTANKKVLSRIQTLRASQKLPEQSYTFAYELHNKELNYDDKIKIINLVVQKNKNIIIHIAPAKGKNKLDQLALSMARAEVLRLYISYFNDSVTIKFAPKLSTDTIHLVTGA